ncbi:hypothetical protein CCMA1212_010261 [Trichoderma ghanense]|uniref:Uncharacterized protein n=1 Tax=Trichoderma ghanense TaxID=65468 RepID=A0ABY2GQN8_9HYPO
MTFAEARSDSALQSGHGKATPQCIPQRGLPVSPWLSLSLLRPVNDAQKGQLPLPRSPTRIFPTTDRKAFPRLSKLGLVMPPDAENAAPFSECMSALRRCCCAAMPARPRMELVRAQLAPIAVEGSPHMRAVSRAIR